MTIDIPALRKLCDEATPATDWSSGVWYGSEEGGWAAIGPHHENDDQGRKTDEPGSEANLRAERDAAFIAAARTALPVALDEVERLRKLLDRACANLDAEGLDDLAHELIRDAYDH